MLESSPRQNDGQVLVGVGIGVGHSASEQDHRVIQQIALAVRDRFQLFKEPGELPHLIFELHQIKIVPGFAQ